MAPPAWIWRKLYLGVKRTHGILAKEESWAFSRTTYATEGCFEREKATMKTEKAKGRPPSAPFRSAGSRGSQVLPEEVLSSGRPSAAQLFRSRSAAHLTMTK